MISEIVEKQREFFLSGSTISLSFRKEMLDKLEAGINKWLPELSRAVWVDLHKSYQEFYLTEIGVVLEEIKIHRKSLSKWAKPRLLLPGVKLFPSYALQVKDPMGSALIIAPWNYPLQLLINPLVGAISAGCTACLKTSPRASHISAVLCQMIEDTFNQHYIAAFEGHRDVNENLLKEKFDVIFYTGSPSTAKVVMKAASNHLSSLVLELGGKSPCIVSSDADVTVAARRIAWGKTVNAGQTCVAPDYLFIQKGLLEGFVTAYKSALNDFFPNGSFESPHYCRMVTKEAFERVSSYLQCGNVLLGGSVDENSRYIEPTLLSGVSFDSPVMQNEIFGPVLPVFEYESLSFVRDFILKREKPLALYFFGRKSDATLFNGVVSSGGMAVNDVVMHVASSKLPFGGVGNSGMGRYHGKESFLCFTHLKSVLVSRRKIEIKLRYAPYRFFDVIRRFF